MTPDFVIGSNVEYRCGCACCDAAPGRTVWFQALVSALPEKVGRDGVYELTRRRDRFDRRRRSSRDVVYVHWRLMRHFV